MKKNGRKKILYIITKAEPFGGAQRYVLDLATHFKGEGLEVSVALGGKGALTEELGKEKIDTVSIKRLERDVAIGGDLLVFFSLIRLLWKERPDIVHLNSSKIGGIGALATRIYNLANRVLGFFHTPHSTLHTRIIFTAHGWAFREDRPAWQRALIIMSSWLTILFSHHVIVLSAHDKQAVASWPFCKRKITIIHNGVKSRRIASQKKAREKIREAASEDIPEEAAWVGTVAELTKNKGYIYALKSFAEIAKEKNVVYIIIGAGEDQEILEREIKNLDLKERVFLLGTDLGGDASTYMRAFDIFLLPSVKEGLPYTLLEAGLAKLPVISTTVGGIPEIITDMESGILVRPKAPHEIAEAIRFFVDYPKRAREYGKSLRERIESGFSQETMFEMTEKVYRAERGVLVHSQ